MAWRKILSPKPEIKRRGSVATIPENLSFKSIITGETCSPCTAREFMNYLLVVEHSAENLQFYLWLRDYEKRWDALPQTQKDLSPELDSATLSIPSMSNGSALGSPNVNFAKSVLAQADFGKRNSSASLQLPRGLPNVFSPPGSIKSDNPFDSPPRTPNRSSGLTTVSTTSSATNTTAISSNTLTFSYPWSPLPSPQLNYADSATNAFLSVGVSWKPFSIQPYRDEITRIIAIYLAEGGPRELNITDRERVAALHALGQTTHPTAFNIVKKAVDSTLRLQAHPNFISAVAHNGNNTRVMMARVGGLGIALLGFILLGYLAASSMDRPWRLFAVLLWFSGITIFMAGLKGVCIMLLPFSNRQIRPWELWGQPDVENASTGNSSIQMHPLVEAPNSYEDKPWQEAYQKKNLFRKLFDKEVSIQDPTLRKIHTEIFWKALIYAAIFSLVMGSIALAIPLGHGF